MFTINNQLMIEKIVFLGFDMHVDCLEITCCGGTPEVIYQNLLLSTNNTCYLKNQVVNAGQDAYPGLFYLGY